MSISSKLALDSSYINYCCCCCPLFLYIAAGGKHFSLAVTAHWQGSPQSVQNYAIKSVDDSGVKFLRPDNALINQWKKGLQVNTHHHHGYKSNGQQQQQL